MPLQDTFLAMVDALIQAFPNNTELPPFRKWLADLTTAEVQDREAWIRLMIFILAVGGDIGPWA